MSDTLVKLVVCGLFAQVGVLLISSGKMAVGWIVILVAVLLFSASIYWAQKKSAIVTRRNLIIEAGDKTEFLALEAITSVKTQSVMLTIETTNGKKAMTLDVPNPADLAIAIAYARSGSKGPSPFSASLSKAEDKGEIPEDTKWLAGTMIAIALIYFITILPSALREGGANWNGNGTSNREVATKDSMDTPEGRKAAYCVPRKDPKNNSHAEILAYLYAKDFIEAKLKAPASAKWPDMEEPTVTSYHTWSTPCVFKVKGRVDSQNGFGAMIRSYYEVVVKYDPDTGRFAVEDFSMH